MTDDPFEYVTPPLKVVRDMIAIPRAQYDALMAIPLWLLKLRSLGYINSGHGRKIADEALAIVRAAGIEIKADHERDERNRTAALRAAGIEIGDKT